ncbi:hypothetical protein TCAL_14360 [Tigriopus californicus]|uniref:C2 domain-containing protein n=1 Tax=Tigriopus californicus TaxID=6832 RepID=A0A553NEQ9_TIGCA|nr:hypothetical protein TCAL_14360 [Tigriopus californicus]
MARCLRMGGVAQRGFASIAIKNDVVIVGAARTPMGSFRGSLAAVPAPRLGAASITEALKRANVEASAVEEVYMGNVLSAGLGQAPDRQAALFAGLPPSVTCTLINKVCASGMKAIMCAAQSLSMGGSQVAVAGGFESMSNVPFYLERGQTPYGGIKMADGLVADGLTDVYNKFHMGNCGENTAQKLSITREEQDAYGMESYRRSAKAYAEGLIQPELFDFSVLKGTKPPVIVKEDEEFSKINFDKFTKLPTVFQKQGGTITPGNASTLSDGGAACVLMTAQAAERQKLKPLARILAFADGATVPIDFPIAPRFATDKLLKTMGMNAQEVDLWEINEAFSVVVLANMKLHELDAAKVNIHGGAVSLGHPLGASGARITNHLIYALKPGQRGMFGARKKDKPKRPPGREGGTRPNYGLFAVPDLDEFGNVNEIPDDDTQLEKELQMLMNADSPAKKAKPPKKEQVSTAQLQSMVAECMQDIPSDEEEHVDDGDDELLNELAEFESDDNDDVVFKAQAPSTPRAQLPPVIEPIGIESARKACPDGSCAGEDTLTVIDERIRNYTEAERRAKEAGEAAKCRRFARGLSTLTQLRAKVKAGKPVNVDDIPPSVTIPALRPSNNNMPVSVSVPDQMEEIAEEPICAAPVLEPTPTATPTAALHVPVMRGETSSTPDMMQPQNSDAPDIRQAIRTRREEAKKLALEAKHAGDKLNALNFLKVVQECDSLDLIVSGGDQITAELIPALPVPSTPFNPEPVKPQHNETQREVNPEAKPIPMRQFSRDDPIQMPANLEDIPVDPSQFGAPPAPQNVAEALAQRLEKYRQDESKAKEEGNDSKARRIGRICKQYQDAIRLHKAGKAIPIEDLPTPLGFAPIPMAVKAPPMPSPNPSVPLIADPSRVTAAPSAAVTPGKPNVAPAKRASMSMRDKQIQNLKDRQTQFKKAALEAKKSGQIEQAREYLRQAKGFDKVIDAAESGLPVDMDTLPMAPQGEKPVDMDFEIISREDCQPQNMSGDRQEMFSKLEQDLIAQVKMCEANRKHFKLTGDIASSNKFQQMMEHTKKDLDALRYAFKRGDPVPRFHYEVRSFSKMIANLDLAENELELNVIQGLSYSVPNPKEIYTYCKMEFPYPKERPFSDKTVVVKETNCPEYNYRTIIPVNPKDKSYQRLFKRSSAKVEVWSKGGFLRSDHLIGTAQIKLQPLETHCEIHDGFPLMDGRKVVGGKVEVKIRIRNPVVTKQIEKTQEKWLVVAF